MNALSQTNERNQYNVNVALHRGNESFTGSGEWAQRLKTRLRDLRLTIIVAVTAFNST